MSKNVLAAAALVTLALTAGCGGNGSSATPTTTALSGKVADGYLANAVVFLDKNRNYQLDAGEPSTVTDQQGGFTLQVNPGEIGQYPIVALAVAGQTTDLDQPGQKVPGSYVLSMPASAVSATSSAFVSPISTLIREKMEARSGKTLSEAMTELRTQMNLPAGMNVMGDYVSLGATNSTDPSRTQYSMMHTAAQNMAAFMGGEAAKVMGTAGNGTTVDVNRFRAMMGAMNLVLPQMATAVGMQAGGLRNGSMTEMMAEMANYIASVPPTVTGMPFRNMSSLFPNMMNGSLASGTATRNAGWPLPFRNMTTHFYYGAPPVGSGVVTSGSGMMGSATGMASQMMN